MQILYSYFRYTGRLFLGYALFVARCNTIRTSWETKKKRLSYRRKCIEEFAWGISLFWLHALLSMSFCCFLRLLPPPSQVTHLWNDRCKDIYLLLCVAFCVVMSRVNSRKNENLSFNTIRFFYKQRFFSTHTQCCSTFSWIELQMLLRCCLIHITIIICIKVYIWYIFV